MNANQLKQWGVSVLHNGKGAMIVQPPSDVVLAMIQAKEAAVTSRRRTAGFSGTGSITTTSSKVLP